MVFDKLLEKYREIWALSVLYSTTTYDSEVFAPKKAHIDKGEAMGIVSGMIKRIITSKEFVELFNMAKKEAGNDFEKGVIRVLERNIHYYQSLPEDFLKEYEKISLEATKKWIEAKMKDDFKIFAPYLEKIIEMSRKKAEFLNESEEPYNVLLDLHHEGMNIKKVEEMFSIKNELKKTMEKIMENWPKESKLKELNYNKEKMKLLITSILRTLGFDFNRGRIDYYEHPFTLASSYNDVRITIKDLGKDFKSTISAAIHEFGHALYELQLDESLSKTPVASQENLGIHESQSRFYEIMVGNSKEFAEFLTPLIKEFLGLKVDEEEVFYYFNTVKPSLIRTEADEVTYNFHILIRFEIEKMIFEEKLNVNEIPQIWNELYEKYLGVKPKTYREGVLQDIHWSMGEFGYFPTYTYGNLLASNLKYKMKVNNYLKDFDFTSIRKWLKERIHKFGNIYHPDELVKRVLGKDLEPELFIKHLKEKYLGF